MTTFISLTDVPSSYSGKGLDILRVNSGETGVEFVDNTSDFLSQYALLAGRSGGQTLIGGTAVGEALTLQSTSNVTRGDIILNDIVRLISAGSESIPAIRYTSAKTAGIYFPGADGSAIAFVVDAVARVTVDAAVMTSSVSILAPTGSVGLNSYHFYNDSNTGMYHPAADTVGISAGGAEIARWNSTGYVTSRIDGSTAASGNLTLSSTQNATKGKIYLGANSKVYFNESDATFYGGTANTDDIIVRANTAQRTSMELLDDPSFPEWRQYINGTLTILSGPTLTIYGGDTFRPSTDKGPSLGASNFRWNTLYQGTSTAAGTSRLVESTVQCDNCRKPMKRGTGSLLVVGYEEDYALAHCPDCNHVAMEKFNHFPLSRRSEIRPMPDWKVKSIKCQEFSGSSRYVRVEFEYDEDNPESFDRQKNAYNKKTNATYLGEIEIASLHTMTPAKRQAWLEELAEIEWESMERTIIMRDEVKKIESKIKELLGVGLELSLSK